MKQGYETVIRFERGQLSLHDHVNLGHAHIHSQVVWRAWCPVPSTIRILVDA